MSQICDNFDQRVRQEIFGQVMLVEMLVYVKGSGHALPI